MHRAAVYFIKRQTNEKKKQKKKNSKRVASTLKVRWAVYLRVRRATGLVRARNRRNVRGTTECPRNRRLEDKYTTGVIVGKVAKREERVNRTRLKSKDRCCEQEVRGQEVRRDTEEENASESFEILAN